MTRTDLERDTPRDQPYSITPAQPNPAAADPAAPGPAARVAALLVHIADRYVDRVVHAGGRVVEVAVPLLVWLFVAAVVGFGIALIADAVADQPAACVTEVTGAGQSVCVPR